MKTIQTSRLRLTPIGAIDFDRFVIEMLTDKRVVEYFYSYKHLSDLDEIRKNARSDFWEHFVESRNEHGLEVWSGKELANLDSLVGWCGLLHTELTEEYGGPELQFMISGNAHGKGYATEMASAVLRFAKESLDLKTIIATVDIPNIASIKVLEKVGFDRIGQIEAYGSADMYLYRTPSR